MTHHNYIIRIALNAMRYSEHDDEHREMARRALREQEAEEFRRTERDKRMDATMVHPDSFICVTYWEDADRISPQLKRISDHNQRLVARLQAPNDGRG